MLCRGRRVGGVVRGNHIRKEFPGLARYFGFLYSLNFALTLK